MGYRLVIFSKNGPEVQATLKSAFSLMELAKLSQDLI